MGERVQVFFTNFFGRKFFEKSYIMLCSFKIMVDRYNFVDDAHSLQLSLFLIQMKKAFIQLHIAVFLAGFTAVLGRLIALNEGLLVWYRLLITVIVLAGMLSFKKEFKKHSGKDYRKRRTQGQCYRA